MSRRFELWIETGLDEITEIVEVPKELPDDELDEYLASLLADMTAFYIDSGWREAPLEVARVHKES